MIKVKSTHIASKHGGDHYTKLQTANISIPGFQSSIQVTLVLKYDPNTGTVFR